MAEALIDAMGQEEDPDLETMAASIEKLRCEWLFANTDGICPEAVQMYLLAIGAMEQAERFAKLCVYAQRRALLEARGTSR